MEKPHIVQPPNSATGRYFQAWVELARLAFPVMLARSGILVMVAMDTIMVGQLGGDELAYYAIGTSPQVVAIMIGVGFLSPTGSLCGQARGAGHGDRCGAIWRSALLHGLLLGLFFTVATQWGSDLLAATGQNPDLSEKGGRVMAILGFGLAPQLVFSATTYFLEATGRAQMGLWVMIAAIITKFFGNLILIEAWPFGWEWGAEGAAWSMVLGRMVMAIGVVAAVFWPTIQDWGVWPARFSLSDLTTDEAKDLRRYGMPLGLSQGLETLSFALLVTMAGLLGAVEVAAYQIAFNLLALIFMGAVGISSATSVLVGRSFGAGQFRSVRRYGWTASSMIAQINMAWLILLVLFPALLASLYAANPMVRLAAQATIFWAGICCVPDGVQVVLLGALRGLNDSWGAALRQIAAFWLVMLPASYVLAFPLGWGISGLMMGPVLGSIASMVLLAVRFQYIVKNL